MEHTELLDLLRSQHTFPGDYTFKVIGPTRDTFVDEVLAAVTRELSGDGVAPRHSVRQSRQGAHSAVTVVVRAETPQMVLAIYAQLKAVPGVSALF